LQSEATQILIALLTVIFMVYFGMPQQSCSGGARRGQQNAMLASVGGTTIYSNDLNLIYNRVFGTDDRGQDGQVTQRKVRSLRAMVLIHLFADRAREMGLRVSDDEFREYIKDPHRNMEFRYFYGRSGEWNGPYYKAYVQNQLRAAIPDYERFKRRELLARKYLAMQSSQIAVPPHEIEQTHEISNTTLNLEFVAFKPNDLMQSISVSDEDIESFMESNADQIEKYYEERKKDEYTKPERVRVRRVFIPKPGKDAGDDKKKEVESKWAEAQKRVLEQGESLAKVAADLNPSFSAKKEGLMDWTTPDNLDQNIAKAIEGKETGVTETIVTEHAYMIVTLEGRKDAKQTPLSEVRGEIAKSMVRKDKVDQMISRATQTLHDAARSTDSLSAALKQAKKNSDLPIWTALSVEETGDFNLEGRSVPAQLQGRLSGMNLGGSWAKIPKIGTDESLAKTAYKELSDEQPVADEVYDFSGVKYVVRLKSRKAPGKDDSPGIESVMKQRREKYGEILGQWTGIFQMPQQEYGPWIETQLENAIDDGRIEIYENSTVGQQFAASFKPAGSANTPKGLKQKLQKKAGSKTIKLNPKGKGGSEEGGGKTIEVNPGGSKSGESGNSKSGESGGE
jgi:parvulin-like peptidyl-prolyl isomerase